MHDLLLAPQALIALLAHPPASHRTVAAASLQHPEPPLATLRADQPGALARLVTVVGSTHSNLRCLNLLSPLVRSASATSVLLNPATVHFRFQDRRHPISAASAVESRPRPPKFLVREVGNAPPLVFSARHHEFGGVDRSQLLGEFGVRLRFFFQPAIRPANPNLLSVASKLREAMAPSTHRYQLPIVLAAKHGRLVRPMMHLRRASVASAAGVIVSHQDSTPNFRPQVRSQVLAIVAEAERPKVNRPRLELRHLAGRGPALPTHKRRAPVLVSDGIAGFAVHFHPFLQEIAPPVRPSEGAHPPTPLSRRGLEDWQFAREPDGVPEPHPPSRRRSTLSWAICNRAPRISPGANTRPPRRTGARKPVLPAA